MHYSYNKPLPHKGGTDAISFYNGLMLISASAPGTTGAAAPKPYYPAVYVVTLNPAKHLAVLPGDVLRRVARDRGQRHRTPAATVRLGLTDPDSNEVVPTSSPGSRGDFMLTSQGDKEQIYVERRGPGIQHLWVLNLSQSVDDTAWSTSLARRVLRRQHRATTPSTRSTGSFWPGTAFVAVTPCDANNAPATCPGPGFPANYLGQLNMYTGHITSVSRPRRGPRTPQGMIFVAY